MISRKRARHQRRQLIRRGHHPEQGADEIYLGNALPEDLMRSSWKSSRLGAKPIYKDGRNFTHPTSLRPWFIKTSEAERKIQQELKSSVPNRGLVRSFQKLVSIRTINDGGVF